MTIITNIEIPADLAEKLTQEAERQGVTPQVLALDLLRKGLPANRLPFPPRPGSLAEALAPFIGVIDTSEHVPGGAQLSSNTSQKFADLLRADHERLSAFRKPKLP